MPVRRQTFIASCTATQHLLGTLAPCRRAATPMLTPSCCAPTRRRHRPPPSTTSPIALYHAGQVSRARTRKSNRQKTARFARCPTATRWLRAPMPCCLCGSRTPSACWSSVWRAAWVVACRRRSCCVIRVTCNSIWRTAMARVVVRLLARRTRAWWTWCSIKPGSRVIAVAAVAAVARAASRRG